MSATLTIELSDAAYEMLLRIAASKGERPEQWTTDLVEWFTGAKQTQPVDPSPPAEPPSDEPTGPEPKRSDIRRFFGSCPVGHPSGLDNEKIDEDLVKEYGRGLSPRGG